MIRHPQSSFRRTLQLALILAGGAAVAAPASAQTAAPAATRIEHDALLDADIVPGELVVTVHRDAKRADLEKALQSLGHKTRILDAIPTARTYRVSVPVDALHECRLRLGIHPYVETCAVNHVQTLQRTFDDPALAEDSDKGWNLRRINVLKAWDLTTGGAKIGIVDSGIRTEHEEFADKLEKPYSVFNRSAAMKTGLVKVKRKGKLSDTYITEHGTHVAGTAAGKAGNAAGTAGVSPDSPIIPIQGLNYVENSQRIIGQHWELVQALNQAIDREAKVINYSIGGPPPADMLQSWRQPTNDEARDRAEAQIVNWTQRSLYDNYASVLDRALREGVIVVKSAGNDDLPAKFDNFSYSRRVISVAATNKDDGRAIFGGGAASNYGDFTTVSAPGQQIWNAYANPQVPYGTMQGTSMAAPHVTGVVALMKTIDPELSRREAADILISTGEQLTTDKPIGPLIDAAAAVEELKRRRENGVPRPNPDTPLIEPRPNPTNPTLPRDGVAIWRGRRAWRNPDVRRLIDLWLSISLPAIGNRNPRQGPFFWDRFGRVISIRVVYTILPPDYADIRYQWLWRNADRLSSRNFGTLSIFVIAAMRSGQFNPAPPANKPGDADVAGDPMAKQSEANGAHPVTTAFKGLATSFEWRQAAGANVATVTFNMNGSEGNVLKQFGLPAKVVVIAKKQGKAFVVPAANPMSVALTAAGANASKAAGGKPANIKATFTFTPAGKTVAMQSKISF